jgi:MFS family permease
VTATGTAGYRAVLALPGVGPLTAVALVARIPPTAAAVVLTLHVVLDLGLGYGAAGLVAAAATTGSAIGAPLLGRVIDRRGLRLVVVLTTVAEGVFWAAAPTLDHPLLVAGAFAAGVLGLPVFTVVRQALTSMVPADQRRPAFALDSMAVELTYAVGPAAGTLLALQLSPTIAMWAIGAAWVAAGIALFVLDPPVRPAAGSADLESGPTKWWSRQLAAVLLATAATTFVVLGAELGVLAALQHAGEAWAFGPVIAVWCLASLVGGFRYGASRRALPQALLVAALAVSTLLVALGTSWWVFALLIIPSGLLCAPSFAAGTERAGALAPPGARGLVMGLHASALTLGSAAGVPLAGLVVDAASPAAAIVVVAGVAVLAAGGSALLGRPAGRVNVSWRFRAHSAGPVDRR